VYRCDLCGRDHKQAHHLKTHRRACEATRDEAAINRPVSGAYTGYFVFSNGTVVEERSVRFAIRFEDGDEEEEEVEEKEEQREEVDSDGANGFGDGKKSRDQDDDEWREVKGRGSNAFGPFEISGRWNKRTCAIELQRRYEKTKEEREIEARRREASAKWSASSRFLSEQSVLWDASTASSASRKHYELRKRQIEHRPFRERDLSCMRPRLRRKRHFVDASGKMYIVMGYRRRRK